MINVSLLFLLSPYLVVGEASSSMSIDFSTACSRFDTYLRVERNLAPRTCEAYRYDLERFGRWLRGLDDADGRRGRRRVGRRREDEAKGADAPDGPRGADGDEESPPLALAPITAARIKDYLAHIQAKHNFQSAAMCRVLSSIRQFFKFCVENELLEVSPAEHIRNPKNPKKLPVFLIENDLRRLLAAPDPADVKGTRDYCLLVLLGMTGVRLKEAVGLDVDDVDLDSRTVKVYGKGRKERYIPLNAMAVDALRLYMNVRDGGSESALFLNRFGRRLSGRMIEKLVKEYCRRAGISKANMSPHKLRHTFATLLHMNDVDILEIQRLLGHASITSTQIYTHTNTRRLQTAVDKISL